ncbi:MAG: TraR/DksA family transcriptional regulator [Methylococcaceae bacterium]
MKDYEEVKKILTEMLEDLDLRLAKITEDIKHTDQPLEKDFAELVTQNENNEVLDQLGNTARTEKELIKQAIARINRGEYGICKVCGEPIKEERLKALPYSSLCIKCASKADN